MSLFSFFKQLVTGARKDPRSAATYQKLSLIAFFAWVGIGADGLSSSCYGPQEAYRALGEHAHLSPIVALLSVITIFLISSSYKQVIELFPTGGGGYLVASQLLSPRMGQISGCALLIDYVLTITVSIASGADAIFSFLPPAWHAYRIYVALGGVLLLMMMNLRGVRESVMLLIPIFLVFVLTHVVAILYSIFFNFSLLDDAVSWATTDLRSTTTQLGGVGLMVLLMRAYGVGAGTYTGIEAVANSMPMLREPKVETGKRTMLYIELSLSIVVFGLMLGYVLYGLRLVDGKTLNALLFERIVAGWPAGWGTLFVWVALFSEATLLFVGAQCGFVGGPAVLANMAKDRWVPNRFALLSDRLVVQNGVLLIGGAALLAMLLTRGSVQVLVVLYSINVFVTFTLAQLGMVCHWWRSAADWRSKPWRRLLINGSGLALTIFILACLIIFKFYDGGWITLAITTALVGVTSLIKREYQRTAGRLRSLDEMVPVLETSLTDLNARRQGSAPAKPRKKTAVLLVNGYSGIGLHSIAGILRLFGETFQRFVFVQIGQIDSGAFKGIEQISNLQDHAQSEVDRYVTLMRRHGFEADGIAVTGVDIGDEIASLTPQILEKYPGAVFFGGQLVFKKTSLLTRWLYNYTIFDIQRRLYQQGIQFVVLPIRA